MKPCTYCGVPADTLDHTIPQSVVNAAADAGLSLAALSRVRYLVVPACRECNSLLGDRVFPTLSERRTAVKRMLRRRYYADLGMPSWDEAEIAELGPNMQHEVRVGLEKQRIIRARLAWTGNGEAAASFEEGYRLRLAVARARGDGS